MDDEARQGSSGATALIAVVLLALGIGWFGLADRDGEPPALGVEAVGPGADRGDPDRPRSPDAPARVSEPRPDAGAATAPDDTPGGAPTRRVGGEPAALGSFGPADAGATASSNDDPQGPPEGPRAVRFLYFVEADQEFDPQAVEAIEAQAVAVQQYWYEQFGVTFHLAADGVEVVFGEHPARWYAETPNGEDERWFRLLNIRDELTRLGIPVDSEAVRTITFPNARIDGLVGANRYEGAWMDGDDISCIDGIVETTPYTVDFPANCLATLAHEMGHVFGLGHEGIDEDCMQFGFYLYENATGLCDFSAENRAKVLADPANAGWLDAEPGDRL